MRLLQRLALLAVLLIGCAGRAAPIATLPPEIKRVLFLGDSITYGGFYTVCVETYFLTRHPDRRIEFLNVGLPSETVSGLSEPGHAGGAFPRPDLHERLDRVLAHTQPDLVIACYGMNDGIYLPLDPARFRAYQDGLQRLRRAVFANNARILHATPPVYVDIKGPSPDYPAVLDRYSDWLLARRAEGWDVADVHGAMQQALAERRRSVPTFSFARDGVHPDDAGHWVIAQALLQHLGARDLDGVQSGADMAAVHPAGAAILKLVAGRTALLKDAWLTKTGHRRPKMKAGLPLADARARAAEIEVEIRAALRPSPPRSP